MRPRPTEFRAPTIALWSYMAFFLFSFFNVSGLLIAAYKFESLPIQPVAFAVACVMVVPLTRSKPGGAYFTMAWIYWIIFAVGGFLGPARLAGLTDKALWQLIIKLWISLLGVPYLTLRTISRDRLPMLIKWTLGAAALGAAFSVVQVRMSGVFKAILSDPGRGSGFWINPNSCAELLGICLFLSIAYPFKYKLVNLSLRGLMILGILATLSRTGVVILLVAFVVYGIAAKRLKTVLQVLIVLGLVALAGTTLIGVLSQSKSTDLTTRRIKQFENIFKGKMGEGEKENDRVSLWKYGLQAIQREPILGLGHRAMDVVVPGALPDSGFGPHNYYIFVWGNSGLLALLAFLAYLFTVGRISYQCPDRQMRAAMLAMTAMIAVIAMTDHAFLNGQSYGPIFAVMVTIAYYNKPEKKRAWVPAMPQVRVAPPPRRPGGPMPRPG